MKNSLATLACCVALVAALSPAFAPVIKAAVNGQLIDNHGPASGADSGHCSRHDLPQGELHGADQARHPANGPVSSH